MSTLRASQYNQLFRVAFGEGIERSSLPHIFLARAPWYLVKYPELSAPNLTFDELEI